MALPALKLHASTAPASNADELTALRAEVSRLKAENARQRASILFDIEKNRPPRKSRRDEEFTHVISVAVAMREYGLNWPIVALLMNGIVIPHYKRDPCEAETYKRKAALFRAERRLTQLASAGRWEIVAEFLDSQPTIIKILCQLKEANLEPDLDTVNALLYWAKVRNGFCHLDCLVRDFGFCCLECMIAPQIKR